MNESAPLLDYATSTADAPARYLMRWLLYVSAAVGLPAVGISVASLLQPDLTGTYGVFHLDALEWVSGILYGSGGAAATALALLMVWEKIRAMRLLAIALLVQGGGLVLQGVHGLLLIQHLQQSFGAVGFSVWVYVFSLLYWWALAIAPLMLGLLLLRPFVPRLLGDPVA